jgi:hypothetical protein
MGCFGLYQPRPQQMKRDSVMKWYKPTDLPGELEIVWIDDPKWGLTVGCVRRGVWEVPGEGPGSANPTRWARMREDGPTPAQIQRPKLPYRR